LAQIWNTITISNRPAILHSHQCGVRLALMSHRGRASLTATFTAAMR